MDKDLKDALYKLRSTTYNLEIQFEKMKEAVDKGIKAAKESTGAVQQYLETANDKKNDGQVGCQ